MRLSLPPPELRAVSCDLAREKPRVTLTDFEYCVQPNRRQNRQGRAGLRGQDVSSAYDSIQPCWTSAGTIAQHPFFSPVRLEAAGVERHPA
jgi:hypothetical protein